VPDVGTFQQPLDVLFPLELEIQMFMVFKKLKYLL
jgi:hypothetical protein